MAVCSGTVGSGPRAGKQCGNKSSIVDSNGKHLCLKHHRQGIFPSVSVTVANTEPIDYHGENVLMLAIRIHTYFSYDTAVALRGVSKNIRDTIDTASATMHEHYQKHLRDRSAAVDLGTLSRVYACKCSICREKAICAHPFLTDVYLCSKCFHKCQLVKGAIHVDYKMINKKRAKSKYRLRVTDLAQIPVHHDSYSLPHVLQLYAYKYAGSKGIALLKAKQKQLKQHKTALRKIRNEKAKASLCRLVPNDHFLLEMLAGSYLQNGKGGLVGVRARGKRYVTFRERLLEILPPEAHKYVQRTTVEDYARQYAVTADDSIYHICMQLLQIKLKYETRVAEWNSFLTAHNLGELADTLRISKYGTPKYAFATNDYDSLAALPSVDICMANMFRYRDRYQTLITTFSPFELHTISETLLIHYVVGEIAIDILRDFCKSIYVAS